MRLALAPDVIPRSVAALSRFIFHYSSEDGITYLCMTDKDFQRAAAFQFLADIKNRFLGSFTLSLLLAGAYC